MQRMTQQSHISRTRSHGLAHHSWTGRLRRVGRANAPTASTAQSSIKPSLLSAPTTLGYWTDDRIRVGMSRGPTSLLCSLCLAVDSTHTAVPGLFRSLVRRSGTHCQMNSEIRRVMLTASNSSLKRSCSAFTGQSINQSILVYYGMAERRPTICTNKNTIKYHKIQ